MSKRKVVVLGLSAHGAAILRNLSRIGYEVWGITHYPDEEGLHSGYGKKVICPDPDANFNNWVSFMKDVGKCIKDKHVLLPTSDKYVRELDKASKTLKKYYRFHDFDNYLHSRL